jgi:hypothetical protein
MRIQKSKQKKNESDYENKRNKLRIMNSSIQMNVLFMKKFGRFFQLLEFIKIKGIGC